MLCGQRKRERLLSFSRLSLPKITYNGERRVRKFGQLPKSDGCTKCNNGMVRHLHALALIALVPDNIRGCTDRLRIDDTTLLHVHVASRITVSLPLIRELVRSALLCRARIAR